LILPSLIPSGRQPLKISLEEPETIRLPWPRRSWQSTQQAASRLAQAADMTARAYQLGDGKLEGLLTARRQANEAALGARLSQLEALEAHYRLRLDAHRLWDFAPGS
jgi:hypothetical protein